MGWLRAKDNHREFSAELSEIRGYQKLTGKTVQCPCCRGDLFKIGGDRQLPCISTWTQYHDMDGDATQWTQVHDCGVKLRIFND